MPVVPHNQGLCPDNCFGCKVASIGFSATAMPTRKGDFQSQAKHEKQINRDLPAYKRLRENGLQPASTVGAANIEAGARSRYEVESGKLIADDSIARNIDRVQAEMKEAKLV